MENRDTNPLPYHISVEWADLEALDLSLLNKPNGKKVLAEQVLRFINKNGMYRMIKRCNYHTWIFVPDIPRVPRTVQY